MISVRLRIWLHSLRNANKHFWRRCRGTVVAVRSEPRFAHVHLTYLCFGSFPFIYKNKKKYTHGALNHYNLSAPKGELIKTPESSKPITASEYEFRSGFLAMVRDQAFSGLEYENPYTHLREFEQLCACIAISGMLQDTLWWKLFSFSLNEEAKHRYTHNIGKVNREDRKSVV